MFELILSKREELLASIICTQVGLKYIRTLVVRGVIIITFQDTEHLCALRYILYRPVNTYAIGQLQSIIILYLLYFIFVQQVLIQQYLYIFMQLFIQSI